MLLQDRVAVITGGARGLGRSMAEAFVRNGASVVIGDIDGDAARQTAEEIDPGRCRGLGCDVTAEADVDALIDAAVTEFGGLDVFVNNAGFTRDATMRKMPLSDFESVLDVHVKGTWIGTRAAAATMRERGRGGAIVNVSSISGKVGNAGQTNYSAAKAGIVGLTKAAAKEVGFAGIRVNAIQPGIIETAMTDAMPDDVKASRLRDVPLGRFGQPEEVASVVVFLASDLASYMTGAVLEITGGRNL